MGWLIFMLIVDIRFATNVCTCTCGILVDPSADKWICCVPSGFYHFTSTIWEWPHCRILSQSVALCIKSMVISKMGTKCSCEPKQQHQIQDQTFSSIVLPREKHFPSHRR
ncbi:hypothetical protein BAE44_0022768 [Dichanthelium oligosanthes]|uniref:Secreted protein n=1 Tax=Dichanthelium oligosanthes TaxID=888268 RepID=A0A1E5UTR6_9POAL|nr:hypothetical protein BAE44_0022768 [Dichanthelium oligosanthes]